MTEGQAINDPMITTNMPEAGDEISGIMAGNSEMVGQVPILPTLSERISAIKSRPDGEPIAGALLRPGVDIKLEDGMKPDQVIIVDYKGNLVKHIG